MLLAAFFPGYLITQIPGSMLIQRVGPKLVLFWDMALTALLSLAIPYAARRSARALAAVLTLMGLVQGPLYAAIQAMKREWLPRGPERALVLRFMSLPYMLSGVLALTVYPMLSVRFGWQAMPIVHGLATGVYSVVWLRLVRDTPPKPEPEPELEPEPEPEPELELERARRVRLLLRTSPLTG